jgi:hypothetical protein
LEQPFSLLNTDARPLVEIAAIGYNERGLRLSGTGLQLSLHRHD